MSIQSNNSKLKINKFGFILWPLVVFILKKINNNIEYGQITYVIPNGNKYTFNGLNKGPNVTISILTPRAILRLTNDGYIGLAKGYIEGEWITESLSDLFDFGAVNINSFDVKLTGNYISRVIYKVLHLRRENTKQGSQKNISEHYDLGNDFFSKWLDPTMTYSSGLFIDQNDETVENAQFNKYRRIVSELNIQSHHRVLEIGCGWGGFAEFLAKSTNAKVTAVTISKEQFDYSKKRIKDSGLESQVSIELCDYRDITGSYDRIVSIEMIEAVGEPYWPVYFSTLSKLLRPEGTAMLQAITVPDDEFEDYRSNVDFIQHFIFPGGMLLSPGKIVQHSQAAGLSLVENFSFADSYSLTLDKWQESFNRNWIEISQLGFDDKFKRLWNYYLSFCSAGFRSSLEIGQFSLRKIK